MPAASLAGRVPPDVLRRVFPENARKELARRLRSSIHTARDWLIWGVPNDKRQALAEAVAARKRELQARIAELDAIERDLRGRS